MSGQGGSAVRAIERVLSALIFALVIWQMYQSTKVGVTPRGSAAREALQHAHVALGLTLLALVVARLYLWWKLPRPARRARVPAAAAALARYCYLAFYLTILALCMTGPLFASSEGHALSWYGLFTIPPLVAKSYQLQVTLGYLHSVIGFWLIYLALFSAGVALWQLLKYRISSLRTLPGDPNTYSTRGRLLHAGIFAGMLAMAAWTPYRIFGVVPFATTKQLVEAGPPPLVDPYAGVGAVPKLGGKTEKDFMWCRFCHSFEAGGPHAVGPNLHRVFGRRLASAPGFYYSDALVEQGRAGVVWDEALVAQLIADPEKFLDGKHRMRYSPITNPVEREQIVAALKAATQ